MPLAAWLIALMAVGALAFAFVVQFGFGIEPCILCLWQRAPFGIAAMLTIAAILSRPYGARTRYLLIACTVVFLIGAGLAVFHTGVELHWWIGTTGCSIQPLHGSSPEDLRLELLRTAVARCDQISWTLLGFSMTNWNIPFSLGLALYSALSAHTLSRQSSPMDNA